MLAYIGDAVYELHVRTRLLPFVPQIEPLHRQTVERVKAAAQARLLQTLQPHLTADEADVVRRGRNCKAAAGRRDLYDYRYATAFEALVGYLHLTGQQARLDEFWSLAEPELLGALAPATP